MEMPDTTVIGRSTVVQGRLGGEGDIEILGHVEGEVTSTGDVAVDSSGLVGGNIRARRVTIRGAVRGNIAADDAIALDAGARVVGDLQAPRISIAEGGLVRGLVQTDSAPHRAVQASRMATSSSASARPAPMSQRRPQESVRPAAPKPPARAEVPASVQAPAPTARTAPPPPVVPAIRKGTRAFQKKRA